MTIVESPKGAAAVSEIRNGKGTSESCTWTKDVGTFEKSKLDNETCNSMT